MNGDQSAIVEFARRAHESARSSANSSLKAEQAIGRMEREIGEIRREMRLGFEALSAAMSKPRLAHASLTEEDWEDSPTGTHKMVSKRRFDAWARDREMSVDAKRFRKILKTAGAVIGAVSLIVAGWLVRHFLGRP